MHAVSEPPNPREGDDAMRAAAPRLRALQAAYREGRLVVSADPGALARARLRHEHAIDARDVADALLRKLQSRAGSRPGRPLG